MTDIRRWKRFRLNPRVKGQLYWAHKYLPRVSIAITDVSEKGIGFISEWKLEEGECELKITSLPTLHVTIKHKATIKRGGRTWYRYGLSLRRKLHSVQMWHLKDAKKAA
ncbi:hypothetical protein [Enterovibrio baiacu]|uniref:hypothetical protein n=1 Tax=Enterovibrio baiacu TaxID=2491023 RepID=UPI001012DCEA|nr:hypothetical protein [Enterovibrio baiacu]MBE1276551.1 hypothetical protein [Enterovibrio baiacu]